MPNLVELPQISVDELKRLREEGTPHVLLDVREEHEWKFARIEGARLLPLSRLARELTAALPADLTPDNRIIVQCHHGVRSAQVTAWLRGGYVVSVDDFLAPMRMATASLTLCRNSL